MEEKNIRDDMKEQSEMTTQLLLSIFDNMDCITQVDEYGRVFVGYQGITFLCMVCNSYIRKHTICKYGFFWNLRKTPWASFIVYVFLCGKTHIL